MLQVRSISAGPGGGVGGGKWTDCRWTGKAEPTAPAVVEERVVRATLQMVALFPEGNTAEEQVEGGGQEASLEARRWRSPRELPGRLAGRQLAVSIPELRWQGEATRPVPPVGLHFHVTG